MRVCDRHPRKPATDTIVLKSTDSTFDLCETCTMEIAKYLSNAKKEAVEGKRSFFGREKKSA